MERSTAGPNISELLDRIVAWAKSNDSVRALLLTGSFGRENGYDDMSDLDIEIYAIDPKTFSDDDSWMSAIDDVWMYEHLHNEASHPTRLVIFDHGQKVDFTLAPVTLLVEMKAGSLSDLHERGFKVLLDKDGLAAALPTPSYKPVATQPPMESRFRAVVEEFWFEAYHVPKYLRRGDLWTAKSRDWLTKELLLQMIEWHAKAKQGQNLDTRHLGIGMKDWTDKQTWTELQETFSGFDASSQAKALLSSAKLFRRLATEAAESLGYEYPADLDQSFSRHIEEMLASTGESK